MANGCFGNFHTVQRGETLWLISQIHGISVDEITAANPDLNPYNLQIGQQICIPRPCDGILHTIAPGDTLWVLAHEHGSRPDEILAANPGLDPQNLQVGEQICIPRLKETPQEPPCDGILHTVRAGDNLWLIAQEYRVGINDILAGNPGLDPQNLQVGMRICIPAINNGGCPGELYTITPGDILLHIARVNNITLQELIDANPGLNIDDLQIGQELCIPANNGETPIEPPICDGILHTVAPGETLSIIAQQYQTTPRTILEANPGLDPNNLQIGQEICIPSVGQEIIPPQPINREVMTYMYGFDSNKYLELLDRTQNSITTVAPDFFEISESGNLLLAGPEKLNTNFIDAVHAQGIKITPFMSNHWNRELGITVLENRDNYTTQLAEAVSQYNFDGVNVDIENVTHLHRDDYTDFVRLLRQKLPADKIVSVAVAANPNGWTTGWHGSYDYKALSDYADYLAIMAYDESYQGGPEGPISSSNFFNGSIRFALDQGVPKEKIVVAIPFFGRYWKEGEAISGFGIGANDVDYLLKNYTSTSRFDDETKSSYAEVIIRPNEPEPVIWGNRRLTAGTYHIWYDGPEATHYKLNVINQNDLKGAGNWTLGQEMPVIWNFYRNVLNNGASNTLTSPVTFVTSPFDQRIIDALKQAGNPRNINSATRLTRGEIAVALAKLAGLSPQKKQPPRYSDITNYWGKGFINALYNAGVLNDFTGDMFSPNSVAGREDVAVMLANILNLPDIPNLPPLNFNDIDPNRWSYNAVSRLHHLNLMGGFSQNFYRPRSPMTIGDIAKFLTNSTNQGISFKSF